MGVETMRALKGLGAALLFAMTATPALAADGGSSGNGIAGGNEGTGGYFGGDPGNGFVGENSGAHGLLSSKGGGGIGGTNGGGAPA